jgi:thiol-disulfide isomerase/thioredoxin
MTTRTTIRGSSGWRFPVPAARRLAPGVLVLSACLGCGEAGKPTAPEEPEHRLRASGVATPALKVGDVLPPLQAAGWVNGTPSAHDAPGVRLLVVDAWGAWCPFCQQATPNLVRVYEKYSGQGVAFVSISNVDRGLVESRVRRHSIKWPNGYGAAAQMIADLGAASGMPGPAVYEVAPTLYLVGPDGLIRWVDGRGRHLHQDAQAWERKVDAAIAEALSSPKP